MRTRLLSLFFLSLAIIAFGQNSISPTNFKDRVEQKPDFTVDPSGGAGPDIIVGQKLSETIIGGTYYDLQTYGAMGQRTFAYPDGTVGAAWMMAFQTTDWADRGIGYNYYDGNSWGEQPSESIATVRTGWACYTALGENGEIAVGHAQDEDEAWVLWFCKRDTKGSGDWNEFTLSGPEPGVGIVWPAIVSGGTDHNTLHVLGLTYGDEYMGQSAALLYSRSTDGGETWEIENFFFDEIGPDYFTSIEADGYAWAAPKGNTIAFSVGFDSNHGCIMKSNDNGDTWEFIEVYNCPFYPAPEEATPDFGAGDGTQSLAIDNDGNVHLVYGRMTHVYDETGAGFFYPATDGVIYWNESMEALDTTIISSYTLEYLQENGNLAGQVTGEGIDGLMDFATYYTSLTSHPQIMIDQSNRIFVLWTGAAPDFDNGLLNYRHIYGNSSSDGGLTWNGIIDMTDDLLYLFSECIYPSIAPDVVDGQIHFTFQDDSEPGIFVWAASQAEAGSNNITYMGIETDALTGITNPAAGLNAMEVSANYPNPFSDVTYIDVQLEKPSEILFTVADVAGRNVYRQSYQKAGTDKLRIQFENQELNRGVYYYTIQAEAGSYTGKMIVQ